MDRTAGTALTRGVGSGREIIFRYYIGNQLVQVGQQKREKAVVVQMEKSKSNTRISVSATALLLLAPPPGSCPS
jgi:hypothetical protein